VSETYIAELRMKNTRAIACFEILAVDMWKAVDAAEELANALGFEFHDVNLKDKS
jgi:hypothetical protein